MVLGLVWPMIGGGRLMYSPDQAKEYQDASAALHAAKARCSQIAQDMGRWAIQYHGAFGYTDEADVGLYVHAGLRWSTWLGNPVAHRRAALAAHRRERA